MARPGPTARDAAHAATASGAFPLGDLAAADESLRLAGDPLTAIGGIAFDVRDVRRGDLFAALDGDPFRGHDVAAQAVARGAGALLLERDLGLAVPALVGPSPRRSLARVAAAFWGRPSRELGVVGITGTDGKTTAAHLLGSIFRAAGETIGAITTIEVRVGDEVRPAAGRLTTPESPDVQRLLREAVDAGATRAIVEATSHGLALSRLDEVDLAVAAATNVTHEHLDFHGSTAAYRRAKAILFERLTPGGTAVANADDEGALALLAHADASPRLLYGAAPAAGVRALEVAAGRDGASFRLALPGAEPVPVRLALPGLFNVSNALCAAACAHACGLASAEIADGLEAVSGVPGRMSLVDAGQPFEVVVDFAHTPTALRQVLDLLRDGRDGRVIVVVGSAGERDLLKRPLLGEVAAARADYAVFTSEDPRNEEAGSVIAQLAAGARAAGGSEPETFACIDDRREAIRHALARACPGDAVLLAGKGHERSIVWGAEERFWDETAVARESLAELGWSGDAAR